MKSTVKYRNFMIFDNDGDQSSLRGDQLSRQVLGGLCVLCLFVFKQVPIDIQCQLDIGDGPSRSE